MFPSASLPRQRCFFTPSAHPDLSRQHHLPRHRQARRSLQSHKTHTPPLHHPTNTLPPSSRQSCPAVAQFSCFSCSYGTANAHAHRQEMVSRVDIHIGIADGHDRQLGGGWSRTHHLAQSAVSRLFLTRTSSTSYRHQQSTQWMSLRLLPHTVTAKKHPTSLQLGLLPSPTPPSFSSPSGIRTR